MDIIKEIIVKEKNNKKIVVRIFYDDNPENPRSWDNLGTIWAPKYYFGYENEVKPDLETFKGVILPIFAYEHGNIKLKTSSFCDSWDSGQIGFIFVSDEKIKEENINKAKAEEILKNEIKYLNKFLNNEVYAFSVILIEKCSKCAHEFETVLNSCFGFYEEEYAEKEGLNYVKLEIAQEGI
ncbi:MAG: hypothetical protein ACTSQY_00770 [Candidatus Odinarchaeia archaeon]